MFDVVKHWTLLHKVGDTSGTTKIDEGCKMIACCTWLGIGLESFGFFMPAVASE